MKDKPTAPPPVHHIGVAVHDIEEAMRFWGEKLGLEIVDRQTLPDFGLKIAFVQTGNTLIELLEPIDPSSTVARFLERRGGGLHHVCFESPDIKEHLRDLADKGVSLVDQTPRAGAHGEVAFLHPAAAHGVLVELIQARPTGAPEVEEGAHE